MADSVINTFEKGLHQDSSFILQPDGTYRNMKNGMLISYDGNHYTVEMTKGNKVLLTLNPRYLEDNNTSPNLRDSVPMPIGFSSFIDKLVVFSTNNEAEGGYGEIGVINFSKVGDDFEGIYTPYYHHQNLNFSKKYKIEAFTFRENDNIERVYWTDNNNEPRVFDIANPIFTDYINSVGGIEDGVTYMVMNGVILYNGVRYAPSNYSGVPLSPPDISGNIFTGVAGVTNFTLVTGLAKIIKYYPLELLDWTPSRMLGNIYFDSYGVGNKNCGTSIYFYRLSLDSDGFKTSWSYASNPIHVLTENETDDLIGINYTDFVGGGTSTTIKNSNRSVKIRVTDIDVNFDTIELCCAEFTQKNDIPYSTKVISKESITGSEMILEDLGLVDLGTVTISDLTLFPASILKCKTLTTNKNYNIIANTEERQEFQLDFKGLSLESFEYPMISHGDLDFCTNGNIPDDESPFLGVNPGAFQVKPYSRYLVTDISGGDITYDGIDYTLGEVFVGVTGVASATIPSGSQCRACTTRNKYTAISDSKRRDSAIELKTGFWDYKDPAVASHNKGYWSDEKYRFAILFFDLKGNPFYARHIGDFTFPRVPSKGGLMIKDTYLTGDLYCLNPSGLKVSGLDIPESVMDQCSGFSIVRAERDPTIITQGLLMQTVLDDTTTPDQIQPLPITYTDYSINETWYSPIGDVSVLLCPDHLVGYEFKNPIGVLNQKIKEAFWLNGAHLKTYSSNTTLVAKMFTTEADDSASPREMELQSMNGLAIRNFPVEGGDVNILGDGKDFYNKYMPVNNGNVKALANTSCTGTWGWADGNNSRTIGCKKSIITPSHFNHYGPVSQYNAWDQKLNYKKIVVNFLTGKDSASQYGGDSDAAIANTTYISTGHFQPINNTVKSETENGTFSSGIYNGEKKYTFNDIEIFGGDCYTNLVDLAYAIWDEDTFASSGGTYGYSLWFPCEGNVNYNLRRGSKASNRNTYPSGTDGINWTSPGGTVLEDFVYNTSYSTEGFFVKYPALPSNYRFTGKFEYRMRWAGLKYPGELINSFRNFPSGDYRDVDGQRGQINNVKARDSKLFYWQDHSTGYAPILERQLVGGGAVGDATALGVTGVLDRYDQIDTYFGNQHQHGLTETEYGFAWFDMRRRAFMVMGIGSKPEEMSMVKGLQVFFNNEFNESNDPTVNSIYNTNNLNIKEAPLLGYGIVGCYDPRFKMTYLTFKYNNIVYPNSPLTTPKIQKNRDFTIGYNHILNAFVSFYDNCPAIWHNHNDLVVTANNPKNTSSYNPDMPSTSYVLGETISDNNIEYICINPVTIVSYPGTTTDGGTSPLALGSTGGANDFWLAINRTNQIYLQNFGANLCKFYGKVWSHEMELVVNFKTDSATTPQNIQFKGTGPNWTDVVVSTDDQAASDLNIATTNRNYRWIDKSWFSSLPLPSNGRSTDYYVKIKFTFKNYITNPTISKNVQKVSQWLKTFLVRKK